MSAPSGETGLTGVFNTVKDVAVAHVRDIWSPLKRVEGNGLVKDIFSDSDNLRKVGTRVAHVAMAVILGLTALTIASAVITTLPLTINIVLGLACVGFAGGLVFSLFPDQIKHLIDLAKEQVNKLHSKAE